MIGSCQSLISSIKESKPLSTSHILSAQGGSKPDFATPVMLVPSCLFKSLRMSHTLLRTKFSISGSFVLYYFISV